jgi:uncharacterized protein (TIGR04222 family)
MIIMSLGPFDLTGEPFLALYLGLFALVLLLSLLMPARLRPEGRRQLVTDPDQLAWLAGGRPRVADALVSRLLAARALVLAGKHFGVRDRDAARTPAERGVLALPQPIGWSDIASTLKDHAEPLERRMTQDGLLMSRAEQANIRFWALLPWLMLLTFGATKWVIGDMRERPVGYLSLLLLLTAVAGAIRFFTIGRRTAAAAEALARARDDSERIRRAPTGSEVGLAVALFGTAVLVGSGWDDFHKLRNGGGDGGGGGGCGDSGSDGGSGSGGGCGGCGGD